MKFADIPAGQTVFVDANPLVDHFSAHSTTGPACRELLERIARQEINAVATTHIIAEMAHRLMTIEACARFGWPYKGIAQRLARHPAEVQQLVAFRQAVDHVAAIGVHLEPVLPQHLSLAADVIQQHGLLYNDALVVAAMRTHGVTNLASNDADFDRVLGIARHAPL